MVTSNLKRVVIGLIFAITFITPAIANQTPPKVKISFGKPAEVMLGATAPILITIDALEKLDSVSVTITLPDGVELRSGNLDHRMNALEKGGQVVLPVDIAVVDAVISRLSVSVQIVVNGQSSVSGASLYLVNYDGKVEILNQHEASDMSERIWLAKHVEDDGLTIPPTSVGSFIQVEPFESPDDSTFSLTFLPGKPFALVNSAPQRSSGLNGPNANPPIPPDPEPNTIYVTVSGYVKMNPVGSALGLGNITVKFYATNAIAYDYLGSVTTDGAGYYSRAVSVDTYDTYARIYPVIVAANSEILVENSSAVVYKWADTPEQSSGSPINFGPFVIPSPNDEAGILFYRLNEAWEKIYSTGYNPVLVHTVWRHEEEGSSRF